MVLCPILRRAAPRPSTGPSPASLAAETRDDHARLAEAVGLAHAIGLDVANSGTVPVARPQPGTLFGRGKVEELKGIIAAEGVELVIVDHALAPVQQRNLEKAWKAKVLDRTGLILEIFGERAQTREGRLQVELAHLTYQKSRLVRSWTHLERQRGGVGFLGGPGETQIEADRRALQEKIVRIRRELDQVKRTRALHREGRKRVPYPTVALVGYTNAGKSTLFNALTGAAVEAKDQLFATLDPTMREVSLPQGTKVILSDTVGFISNLPTNLIAAFRATLEEVLEADLILHVRDISSDESGAQRDDVEHVLKELGVDTATDDNRVLEIWNKIDLLDAEDAVEVRNMAARKGALCVSAVTGTGMEALCAMIEDRLNDKAKLVTLTLEPDEGALMSWLHDNAHVLDTRTDEYGSTTIELRISREKLERFNRRRGGAPVAAE
ncbi:MAG: GTPase HflX [Hyphomicrobiaceae bacterium]|nr:GTPase HflX [Hyphomicrobiaceae bacterium]